MQYSCSIFSNSSHITPILYLSLPCKLSQITSATRKSTNCELNLFIRFAGLPQIGHFADLRLLFWDKEVQHFVEICGFAICRLTIKYAELRFAESTRQEILWSWNSGKWAQEFAGFRFNDLKKCACPPLLNKLNMYTSPNTRIFPYI